MTAPDVAVSSTFTYDAEPEFQYGWRLGVSATVPCVHEAPRRRAGRRVRVGPAPGRTRRGRDRGWRARSSAALTRATAARDQMTRYQSSILPLALESERQAQAAYSGGQTGLPALVQALQTARETRQRGLQAGLDYQHALADLERAIGASDR